MAATRPTSTFPFRLEFPPELPISARAEEITSALAQHQVVILAGETGSGKTTQIPKLCLAAGGGTRGRIACTQPRRVAALSVSRRVAEELGVEWGRQVGCKVRFDDHTSRDTVVKFLTDGMLLAEVQGDPQLREYDTIIIDEAHERSLNIDFLLGHLRNLRFQRPELRIVITSATIDTAAFSEAFDHAPIIEVSGRTYPVDVQYAPLDSFESEGEGAEALHYVDGAVEAISHLVGAHRDGDVLAFFPSERDIRDAQDALGGRKLPGCEIIPLFGRLTNVEQQRVFSPSPRRKIILSTNIAETSLTLTGIRFVVDTGLARVSRYAAGSRTRRLPIEPVARSSADQRKGRAGRVAAGLCVRLYSEEDYEARPKFTQPEIQRANLADVILRLAAVGLGAIERFPFLNPPLPKSIQAGYALLEELGAIEPHDTLAGEWTITRTGHELARLPVDPTVARMILQARDEKCLREVLVIAAALSIQDPRERPLDKQDAADAAHRRFVHPESDFLTLLNIWETFHDEVERLTQSRLRRFCREHFLSYTRVREWRDVHGQLVDTFGRATIASVWDGITGDEVDMNRLALGSPGYRAIHRSILSGLLANIATWDEQHRTFRATQDRRVAVFPGSTLFRAAPRQKRRDAPGAEKPVLAPPSRWILIGEVVETSRLYARTCAKLDPEWVLELGAHIVRVTHGEPRWAEDKGRVVVKQRSRLHGLEIDLRFVGYSRVDPEDATEIFIREALVADTLKNPLPFIEANRRTRAEVESLLSRTRDRGFMNLDETVYRFYATELLPDAARDPVSGVGELRRWLRNQAQGSERLTFNPDDLRPPEELSADLEAYPAEVPLDNSVLPLVYAYRPGQADDGVTLDVNIREVATLDAATLDWAVPGHLPAKVEHYLRALPKDQRRALMPLNATAVDLARSLPTGSRQRLTAAIEAWLRSRFKLVVDTAAWAERPLPEHLQVRVRVLDDQGKELWAGRDLAAMRAALREQERAAADRVARQKPDVWAKARAAFEKPPARSWAFGRVPERIQIGEQAGVAVWAYPGLVAEAEGVALRLFADAELAVDATRPARHALMEEVLGRDLGWLERDLKALKALGLAAAGFAPIDELRADALFMLKRWLCRRPLATLDGDAFLATVETARADLRGLVPRLVDTLREILDLRQKLIVHPQAPVGMVDGVQLLLPRNLMRVTSYPRLEHLARYLKAHAWRTERWRQNPRKDAERVAAFAPYAKAQAALKRRDPRFWLIEEYRVSLFAQEVGTAEKVSPQRLDRELAG